MAASLSPPPVSLGYLVELNLSCQGLKDADILSKSDPLVAAYIKTHHGSWSEFGRTEHVKNTLNPVFTKAIEICYRFEEKQDLKFAVYDIDNLTETLSDDELLGTIECSLAEVVNEKVYTRPLLLKGKKSGSIKIQVEETTQGGSNLDMNFSGHGLDKKDLFGKSDPYLEFSRMNQDGSYIVVHRNDFIKNTLNPVWPMLSLSSKTLCNNIPDRPILVKCYDWDSDGGHDLIGEFTTSLQQLQTASDKKEKIDWKLINPKKASKKNYDNSGTIRLESITIRKVYSFLDYVMGGCTINFTVGIDFTASNGNPKKPSSLHYYSPDQPNEYMNALRAVGYICQDYDSDKLFPSFGFGAQIQGKVSHQFPLNNNPSNPYCFGVEGVVSAYHQALQAVDLSGPTNMAPLINHVSDFAEAAAAKTDRQDYFVLLILTDGDITDMMETKRAIIRGSRLPMSIIIVGVGSCSFLKMVELDSDDKKLRIGSNVAERDIVQFVPYRQYAKSHDLAREVLAEVPTQFIEYMQKRGIAPLKVY